MIKLKKFNENFEDSEDDILDYIKHCFVEFLDKPNTNVEIDGVYQDLLIEVSTYIEEFVPKPEITKIEELLEYSNKVNEFYKDIETAIKRVLDEYPKMSYNIQYYYDDGNVFIHFYDQKFSNKYD